MKLIATLLPALIALSMSAPAFAAVRPKMDRPVDSFTDSAHVLDAATKDGATTTKVGGGTLLQDPATTGGTGTASVKPTVEGVPPDQESRTASDELRKAPMPASSIAPAASDSDSAR